MFENEVLEDVVLPPNSEPVAFDRETGEVTEQVETGRANRASDSGRPTPKRFKRTERQMIASLGGSALKEANYALDRIRKLEDKIGELMGSISQKGRERVLEERPDLSKY